MRIVHFIENGTVFDLVNEIAILSESVFWSDIWLK